MAITKYDGGAGMIQCKKFVVDHAELTASATSEVVDLGALSADHNAIVVGVTVRSTTGFTGGSLSTFVVDVGAGASGEGNAIVNEYTTDANVFAAKSTGSGGGYCAAGQVLKLNFTGSHNTSTSTAGSVSVTISYVYEFESLIS